MEQLQSRIQFFRTSFAIQTGLFELANLKTSTDLDLILKRWNTNATYEPSNQSRDWLILEHDLFDSILYNLHLVPIAAIREEDSGGRDEFTSLLFLSWLFCLILNWLLFFFVVLDAYSSFLLASYDDIKEEYEAICYIGNYLSIFLFFDVFLANM